MHYPTLEEVQTANQEQVCRWRRFLPSPGESEIGKNGFEEVMLKEVAIMNAIIERSKVVGGFTPEISKRLGWG